MKYNDEAILETVEDEMERDEKIIQIFETWEKYDQWIDDEVDFIDIPEECDNF